VLHDDPIIHSLLLQELNEAGFSLRLAEDGREARSCKAFSVPFQRSSCVLRLASLTGQSIFESQFDRSALRRLALSRSASRFPQAWESKTL
jgi:hypothetical protein